MGKNTQKYKKIWGTTRETTGDNTGDRSFRPHSDLNPFFFKQKISLPFFFNFFWPLGLLRLQKAKWKI